MVFRIRQIGLRAAATVAAVLFLTMVCPNVQAGGFVARQAEDAAWIQLPDSPEASSIWARGIIRSQNSPTDAVVVRLASKGVVTLYVNGQRLLKNERLSFNEAAPSAVSIDVTRLLRVGTNSIAVALSGSAPTDTDVRLAVAVHDTASGKLFGSIPQWKQATDAPPVGWQQTDFNDGDWKPFQATSGLDFATVPAAAIRTVKAIRSRPTANSGSKDFELLDGDHVVLLGATFVERAQRFGHLESGIAAWAGKRRVTIRNLGWSADTVWADSRGIFDSPAQGYQRMIEHVRAEEPSVILICYGQNEAIQNGTSDQAMDAFRKQLTQLVNDVSTTGARIVLVSPHALLPSAPPIPSPDRYNHDLKDYAELLQDVATDLGCSFVNVFDDSHADLAAINNRLVPESPLASLEITEHMEMWKGQISEWTDNGMHWNDEGYRRISGIVREQLFADDIPASSILIGASDKSVTIEQGEARNIRWSVNPNELVRLEFKQTELSAIPIAVRIAGAGYGSVDQYVVTIPAEANRHHSVESLRSKPNSLSGDRQADQKFLIQTGEYDVLRDLIVRKNELYFHRWRPQNITYLFGFRKHEQGNNASEIARFDPLVDQLESQIHAAQTPGWVTIVVRKPDITQESNPDLQPK